jgi:aldehyde:ferredoxin oxidoreductase
LPGRENGNWTYIDVAGRVMDKAKFDEWKTKFYTLEGWDTSTGWPTRSTLEGLGLNKVADKLEANGKLGAS